jgi:hypothetical protein
MGKRPLSDDEASAEHRKKLEAMFGGGGQATEKPKLADGEAGAPFGGVPSAKPRVASERVFSSPRRSLGRSPSEYRLRLERLRMARDENEIREAADTFLQFHQLPDDPEILTKVMQHPSERVVREALGQISALLMQGRMAATVLIEERLRELESRCTEDATRSYVAGIQGQLQKMKT